MKPTDFYLSSRHIFGTLVPGMVWLVFFGTLFSKHEKLSVDTMIPFISFSKDNGHLSDSVVLPLLLAGLVLSSFVIGLLMTSVAFTFTNLCVNSCPRFVGRSSPSQRRQIDPDLSALRSAVNDLFSTKYYGPLYSYLLKIKAGDRLFSSCKQSAMFRAPELMRRLMEKEDEINLYATLPLPVIACGVAYFISNPHITAVSIGFGAVYLGCALYFMWLFSHSRVDEEKDCYQIFLLLETDLTKPVSQKQPDSTPPTEEIG
jgi:hypothetical protein